MRVRGRPRHADERVRAVVVVEVRVEIGGPPSGVRRPRRRVRAEGPAGRERAAGGSIRARERLERVREVLLRREQTEPVERLGEARVVRRVARLRRRLARILLFPSGGSRGGGSVTPAGGPPRPSLGPRSILERLDALERLRVLRAVLQRLVRPLAREPRVDDPARESIAAVFFIPRDAFFISPLPRPPTGFLRAKRRVRLLLGEAVEHRVLVREHAQAPGEHLLLLVLRRHRAHLRAAAHAARAGGPVRGRAFVGSQAQRLGGHFWRRREARVFRSRRLLRRASQLRVLLVRAELALGADRAQEVRDRLLRGVVHVQERRGGLG